MPNAAFRALLDRAVGSMFVPHGVARFVPGGVRRIFLMPGAAAVKKEASTMKVGDILKELRGRPKRDRRDELEGSLESRIGELVTADIITALRPMNLDLYFNKLRRILLNALIFRAETDRAAFTELMAQLASQKESIAEYMMTQLVELGSQKTHDLMASEMLTNVSPQVRALLAEALGRMKDQSQASLLEKALGDKDPGVRVEAALALGRMGSDAMIQKVRRALKDQDSQVRRAAIDSIAALAGLDEKVMKDAADVIRPLAQDKAPLVRGAALKALGRLDPNGSMQTLLGALTEATAPFEIRIGAIYGLISSGRLETTDALIKALKDPAWQVRSVAIEGLRTIGDKDAVNPLKDLIAAETGHLHVDAEEALAELQGGTVALQQEAAPPPGTTRSIPHKTTFGHKLYKENIVWVLDPSGSMARESRGGEEGEGTTLASGATVKKLGLKGKGVTKWDFLVEDVKNAIEGLSDDSRASIVIYKYSFQGAQQLLSPGKSTVLTNRAGKNQLQSWINGQKPKGWGDFWDAINAANAMHPDRIVLVSDGVPSAGRGGHAAENDISRDRFMEAVARKVEFERVRIDVVLIGEATSGISFMADLAKVGHGDAVQVSAPED